jgi:hypothetical protein
VTDKALKNAERKRDSLAAEINSLAQRMEELKRDLAKIDAWIAQWHELAGPLAATKEAAYASMFGSDSGGDSEPKRRRSTGNPKKEDVAEAARKIIKERGEPVSRSDLFKALADVGIVISSETDPEMVLSTMLWRMRDRIARLKTGGYWLAEKAYPEAGYDPQDLVEAYHNLNMPLAETLRSEE